VASAIEYAAARHADHVAALVMSPLNGCPPELISFKNMFLSGEIEEEQTSSLAMRLWNVSATATIWLSRSRVAAPNAAGSFPLGPGLNETWTVPQGDPDDLAAGCGYGRQIIPTNSLSAVATAAGTPFTVEAGGNWFLAR
jgi:hypothetical protein